MSFPVDQQVLRLKVAIDDILFMHVADSQQYLTDIEHSHVIAKSTVLP